MLAEGHVFPLLEFGSEESYSLWDTFKPLKSKIECMGCLWMYFFGKHTIEVRKLEMRIHLPFVPNRFLSDTGLQLKTHGTTLKLSFFFITFRVIFFLSLLKLMFNCTSFVLQVPPSNTPHNALDSSKLKRCLLLNFGSEEQHEWSQPPNVLDGVHAPCWRIRQ